MPTKINYLLFLFLASVWGGSFIAIKIVVVSLAPFFAAALRLAIATLSLWLMFQWWHKSTPVPFTLRWKIWLIGLFAQGFPFAFLFWGERFIDAGLAGILNGTVPIWAFLISLIIEGRSISHFSRKILGLLLGIIGIVIIFWPMLHLHASKQELVGTLAVTGMAICYAIAAHLNHFLLAGKNKIDFAANLYYQHWASFIFLLLLTVLTEPWPSWSLLLHSPVTILASVYLGLVSTALAWLIYYYLIREWDAIRASTVAYLIPIMALLWDFIFLHHAPTAMESLGIIPILAGVIFIQWPRGKAVKCCKN